MSFLVMSSCLCFFANPFKTKLLLQVKWGSFPVNLFWKDNIFQNKKSLKPTTHYVFYKDDDIGSLNAYHSFSIFLGFSARMARGEMA